MGFERVAGLIWPLPGRLYVHDSSLPFFKDKDSAVNAAVEYSMGQIESHGKPFTKYNFLAGFLKGDSRVGQLSLDLFLSKFNGSWPGSSESDFFRIRDNHLYGLQNPVFTNETLAILAKEEELRKSSLNLDHYTLDIPNELVDIL